MVRQNSLFRSSCLWLRCGIAPPTTCWAWILRTARERAGGGGECGNWAKGGERTFVGEIVESIVEWMNEHETATVIIVSILTTIATRAILSAIG